MPRQFLKLRAKMLELDINEQYLAKKLELSSQSISNRLNNRYPWTLWEMYAALEILREPPERLFDFFPPPVANPKMPLSWHERSVKRA